MVIFNKEYNLILLNVNLFPNRSQNLITKFDRINEVSDQIDQAGHIRLLIFDRVIDFSLSVYFSLPK